MRTGPIGVGIVGTGRISDLHAIEYLANPAARIVALCDSDTALAERRARAWGLGGVAIDELTLQEVLFENPGFLGEIDPAYRDAVPVCTELGTRAGWADALHLTPTGGIALAEFKLWRQNYRGGRYY